MGISHFQELMFGEPDGDHGRVLHYYKKPDTTADGTIPGAHVLCHVWDRHTYDTPNGTLTLEKGQGVRVHPENAPPIHGEVFSLTDGTIGVRHQDEHGQDQYDMFMPAVTTLERT